jgi:hypothetical protein
MRFSALLLPFCASLVIAADGNPDLPSSTTIYVESIGASTIASLAEIKYNPYTLDAELTSYDPPEIPASSDLVRVGVYDKVKNDWASSTSVTSAESFSKGYSPIIILSLGAQGEVLGVTCKSGRIDAGQTRDFGPKVKVVTMTKGKSPDLNKPIVLKEGRLEAEVPEKTLLQRYVPNSPPPQCMY